MEKIEMAKNKVFQSIFGLYDIPSLDNVENGFMHIPHPKKYKCRVTSDDTWAFNISENVISQKAVEDRFGLDGWMMKKRQINDMDEILKCWQELNFSIGDKIINSEEVYKSDSVFNSVNVYKSVSIFDSKSILFSYKMFDSSYMIGSRDCSSTTVGISVSESIFCTNCFNVNYSNKVSNSMFISNSYDLFECMFCAHLRSKKYCIANMQFEKDEYLRIKKLVLEWVINRNIYS